MTWSVYQHWDPLRMCVVGRSYPPEFYSWIQVPRVRSLFEKIAIETEEDYQKIIQKLRSFGVTIMRPELPQRSFVDGRYVAPPMCPRDHMVMIGQVFYENISNDFVDHYNAIRDASWPDCQDPEQFLSLSSDIRRELIEVHGFEIATDPYWQVIEQVKAQGNQVRTRVSQNINGAFVTRIGRDLYFGTTDYEQDQQAVKQLVDREFLHTRNHMVNTGGHSDGTYCPVCPGLIISLHDIPTYEQTFPGWEVVYLPAQSWSAVGDFLSLKRRNRGRWWIPGFEHDTDVVDTVERWLSHWTGYVEETVFDVNMLIVDPKNVLVFNYNQQVFDALEKYGITPHVVTFRHRYFWDGGIHCVTTDLDRQGSMQDYFPYRG